MQVPSCLHLGITPVTQQVMPHGTIPVRKSYLSLHVYPVRVYLSIQSQVVQQCVYLAQQDLVVDSVLGELVASNLTI